MLVFKPLSSKVVYGYADYLYAEILLRGNQDDETILEFFENIDKLAKPHKETLLHDFIHYELTWIIDNSFRKTGIAEPLEDLLEEALLPVPKWVREERFDGREAKVDRLIDGGVRGVMPSVFFLLFSDRNFLLEFQKHAATKVRSLARADYGEQLVEDGRLRRVPLPVWLKKGVYFRDRGRCQLCFGDVSCGRSGTSTPCPLRRPKPLLRQFTTPRAFSTLRITKAASRMQQRSERTGPGLRLSSEALPLGRRR